MPDAAHTAAIVAANLTAAAALASYATFAPASNLWGRVIYHAPPTHLRQVSLTFDDGPTPGATDRVLDQLAAQGIKATFFVIGRSALAHPDLLRRIDADGHLLANHTFDHGHFDLFRGRSFWNDQFSRTSAAIASIIGKTPALFRPAMGFTTLPIHHAARAQRHAVVTWSRRARDGVRVDPSAIVRRLMRRTAPGDILMLHDGVDPHLRKPCHRDRTATIAAIPPLAAALRRCDLNCVRLDELLQIPGYAEAASLPDSVARTAR